MANIRERPTAGDLRLSAGALNEAAEHYERHGHVKQAAAMRFGASYLDALAAVGAERDPA